MATQLEKFKIRLGISPDDTSKDIKLECILEDVGAGMLEFTNRTSLLTTMSNLQIEIAIISYNKETYEGVSSGSQGGVSTSWIDGLPQDLQSRLVSYRRLKAVGYATTQSQTL